MGCPINDIKIHPGGRRLLIHSRSIRNALLMVDMKLCSLMTRYEGSQSFLGSSRTRCCISPCGSYVFAGSQDGGAYVWNTDTGQTAYLYTQPFLSASNCTVTAVAYHPHRHFLVLASSDPGLPVLVYTEEELQESVSQQCEQPNQISTTSIQNEDFECILQKLDMYLK
ncbi:Uncharacterized protein FKW44_007860 [Caligus rogercresseyi]|uniref:WD repeat-containing protein 18 n=1 Tax=Caligus rogercresseyi TaxID=217165 RepID=A0A7T8KFN0_CALRO|nr:Uncharacterized protein FKW44_007860 [Caligus rogercresseyi]